MNDTIQIPKLPYEQKTDSFINSDITSRKSFGSTLRSFKSLAIKDAQCSNSSQIEINYDSKLYETPELYHRSTVCSSTSTLRPGSNKRDEKNYSKFPLTPQATSFQLLLTAYEQKEILMWPEIYYAGSSTVEKIGSLRRRTGADLHDIFNINGTTADEDGIFNNSGYDDNKGDLYLTKHDHIGYRFEILSLLGCGSFGQVVKCYDHKTKSQVALKIIRNKRRFEKQGLVEVTVLNKLTSEDADGNYNLVHVQDHFYFRGHLCFAFELLGANLYEWIKAGSFRGVHLGIISCFASQILKCLSLLADLKIIHCDLKPENILLKDPRSIRPRSSDSNPTFIPDDFNPTLANYQIKVIDFGSSCYEKERLYTYVQSRFYRSPEVILGLPYTSAIDMWSFGCVLVELYTGYPLFPGENETDQLACIMELKGLPPKELLSTGSRTRTFFDSDGKPRNITNSKGKKRRLASKSLGSVTKCSDLAFLDFITQCLEWDPVKRLKPSRALKHPFITEMLKSSAISNLEMDCELYTRVEKSSTLVDRKTIRKVSAYGSYSSNSRSKDRLPAVGSLERWKGSFLASKDYSNRRASPINSERSKVRCIISS